MSNLIGAKYNIPEKTDANGFMFLAMNELPLLFPCKALGRTSSAPLKTGEKDADFQINYKCRVQSNEYTEVVCYAVSEYPYKLNQLKTGLAIKSENIHPTSGIIIYICPYLLETANKTVQLQAKIHWLIVNRDRFSPTIFNCSATEKVTFDSFFSTVPESYKADGSIGLGTRTAIKCVIKAYFYCENSALTLSERKLEGKDAQKKIDDTRVNAFIDNYVKETEISEDAEFSVVRDFNSWFTELDFSKMSWDA